MKFHLYEHPWLSLLAVIMTIILSNVLSAILIFGVIRFSRESATGQFAMGVLYQILTVFVFVPFVLRLPNGTKKFRQYLNDIGLSNVQPFIKLLLLALSCYLILVLSQAAASFVYRFLEGQPINKIFIRQVFDLSGDLNPDYPSLLISFPSIFEEAVFRGIILTVFQSTYSDRNSIIFSALGFSLMHALNLVNGADLVWTLGQVVWTFIIGLFYGYVFVRTKSLLPSMIVHYLGNAFIGSLTGYIQTRASIEIQVLYGVIFSLGVVPTTLMMLWTRFFASKWLSGNKNPGRPQVEKLSSEHPAV
ncbi:MAG: CPBP family intramembrane metalloprotease [Anaerolineales bacterium]